MCVHETEKWIKENMPEIGPIQSPNHNAVIFQATYNKVTIKN